MISTSIFGKKIFALIGNFALNEFLGVNLKFALIEIALIEARTNRGIAVVKFLSFLSTADFLAKMVVRITSLPGNGVVEFLSLQKVVNFPS